MTELKLPELGENIEMVDVSAVLVSVGDAIHADQPVIEVETEKASLEVPATCGGRVAELKVRQGDKVRVGQVLLVVETDVAADAKPAEPPRPLASVESRLRDEAGRFSAEAAQEPAEDPVEEPAQEPAQEPTEGPTGRAVPSPGGKEGAAVVPFAAPRQEGPTLGLTVPAAPSVRALARELGVDVREVPGSGPGGRITRGDVKAHAKRLLQAPARTGGDLPGTPLSPALPDFEQWGEIAREPLGKLRQSAAARLGHAWSVVPHVTQFDRADITALEEHRSGFNKREEAAGRKLTLTAFVVKHCAAALRKFPRFNASLDVAAGQVILKKYIHVGVAVDTERGLLVPVLRGVDRKSLLSVAKEMDDLAERARAKKIRPDEMSGASFTVSNLGGLGTTHFSPIVPWPEVAILGVGKAEIQPVFREGRFEPRLLLPLSLSYDHRLIDGADAARFLRWLAEALEQPLLLLLGEGSDEEAP